MAPIEAAPASPPKGWRDIVHSWIWRGLATIIWLWLVAAIGPTVDWLTPIRAITIGQLAAVTGTLLIAAQLIKRDSVTGCILSLLGFPFYVVLWPVLLPFYLLGAVTSLFTGTVRRSRQFVWALLPYGLTLAIIALADRPGIPGWGFAVAALAAVGIAFVLISLVGWVFQPLPWASAIVSWTTDFQLRTARSKSFPSSAALSSGTSSSRDDARQAIKSLAEAHTNIAKATSGLPKTFDDTILVAAFTRKFLVSLLHVGILFAIVHYVINRGSGGAVHHYQGLSASTFQEAWLSYLYFGMMTLLSGDSGVLPLTAASRIAVLINALGGVAFLVILITMFSMVSRERTRSAVSAVRERAESALASLELLSFQSLLTATQSRALNDGLCTEFARLRDLKYLSPTDASTYRGILLLHQLIRALEASDRSEELADATAIRAKLPLTGYAVFHDRTLESGRTDPDSLLSVLKSVSTAASAASEAT